MRIFKNNKNKILKLSAMTSMATLLTACDFGPLIGQKLQHYGTPFDDNETGVGNGYDVFNSSAGADRLTGVYGTDFHHANMVDYSYSPAGINVTLDGSTQGIGGDASGDVLIEIDDIVGSEYDDKIVGNEFDNEIIGGAGDDILIGLAGDDIIKGGNGDNQLIGGAGDDRFEGGTGANQMDGGDGKDAMSYLESAAGVKVNLLTGAASGGQADGDSLTNIEYILGTYYDDELIGNASANGFTGLAGDDLLDGGSDGDDILYAGPGDDIIISRFGDDDLSGGDGDDVMSAGAGNDRLRGGDGADVLTGGAGDDELFGGGGIDKIVETAEGGASISYEILKADHKITISISGSADVETLSSIEIIEVTAEFTKDVKNIWSDLENAEQAKFSDETDFLDWLGMDGGYNYEGL